MTFSHDIRSIRDRQPAATLPVPLQTGLFCGLAGLVLWILYFSPYPPVHNALHHTRHTTIGVPCY